MKQRIAYTKPSVTELEVGYATDAARNGWGERCYDYLHRFEAQFREYLGVKHAIATSSCTGALHLGLAALGVGAGDEVILADSNWIASVAPAVHLGATPVFVDILPDSWCLDPDRVEAATDAGEVPDPPSQARQTITSGPLYRPQGRGLTTTGWSLR